MAMSSLIQLSGGRRATLATGRGSRRVGRSLAPRSRSARKAECSCGWSFRDTPAGAPRRTAPGPPRSSAEPRPWPWRAGVDADQRQIPMRLLRMERRQLLADGVVRRIAIPGGEGRANDFAHRFTVRRAPWREPQGGGRAILGHQRGPRRERGPAECAGEGRIVLQENLGPGKQPARGRIAAERQGQGGDHRLAVTLPGLAHPRLALHHLAHRRLAHCRLLTAADYRFVAVNRT